MATVGLAVALLAGVGTRSAAAQGTTGKLEGTVTDAAGQPVSRAQVRVLGTALGAVTSDAGYYFINSVPAGVYTLFAASIGLQPTEVRGVRVLGDQTMTVNVTLQEAVELGAIIVRVQENPLVPRDQVTTKTIVTGSLLGQMPLDDLQDVLNLQPGVVESDRGLSLRGGRPGEAAVYVDGALVRSAVWGTASLVVATNALEEASVTTGAIGVEYGDAQSGVISLVTRAGGPRIGGSISYETDAVLGADASIGLNRVEASLGGPIAGALTFFVAATLDGRQSDLMGRGFGDLPTYVIGGVDTSVVEPVTVTSEWTGAVDTIGTRTVEIPRFIQYGGSCEASENSGHACLGRRRPYNWSTVATAQTKLQYTYGGGSRVSASYLMSRDQGRFWSFATAFAPQLTRGHRLDSKALVLSWIQQVTRGTERNLAFDVSLSYQTDREVAGPLAAGAVRDRRTPFGGWSLAALPFVVDFEHFSDDTPAMYGGVDSLVVTRLRSGHDWDQLVHNVRTNQGTRVPYLNRNDLRNTQESRMNPWAEATGFPTNGLETAIYLSREDRYTGRAFLDWQIDRYSRVRLGGDAQVSRAGLVNTSPIEQAQQDVFWEKPVRYALFGEERLDLGDVVLELGLRWDYFNTRAYFPVLPGFGYTHPNFDRGDPLDPADSVFVQGTGHALLSPRLRVSFPVTDRTGFRLSYAHQVQTPDFWTSLTHVNVDRSLGAFTHGQDLTFGRTIQFEFGIRHAFSPDFVVDVSAYDKEKVSDFTTRQHRFPDPRDLAGKAVYFASVLANADFGNVRGVDVNVVRRIGEMAHAQLAYTLQVARGTGSDPWSAQSSSLAGINTLTGEPFDPPQAIFPTDDSRLHTIAGAIAVTLPTDFARGSWAGTAFRDVGAFLRVRLASGLPYTPLEDAGLGALAPYMGVPRRARAGQAINSVRMPWERELDLRLTKGFRVGGTRWTAFADIRNVLNLSNLRRLFAETGGPESALHRTLAVDPEVRRLQLEAGAFAVAEDDGTIAIVLPDDCGLWQGGPVNCVLLKRAEARFGNGDGVYAELEYRAAFDAAYDQWRGTFFFYTPPRNARFGLELRF